MDQGSVLDSGFTSLLVAGGSASIAVAALLWALRVTDGARGGVDAWKRRAREMEDKVAWADAIFGAHPGVVLIWDDAVSSGDGDWGKPRIYGSPLALASLLRFSDAAIAAEPSVRILQGLSVLPASDPTGASVRLAQAITRLRREGIAFSIKISTPDGVYVEVDGRTAGARAVVWILDAAVRGVEEGGAKDRIGGGHQVIARDPASFLEMWNDAPFMAWRVNGALKLEWANPAYLAALESKSLDQALTRNLQLDQGAVELARKALETGEAQEEVRSAVVGGQLRTLMLRVTAVAGGAAGVAVDVTDSEAAREQLARQQRAHDETLNYLAEGIAVFDSSRRLAFHNSAFEKMWGLEPAFLAERPAHAAWLDYMKEKRKLPAHANYAEWRARELAHYQETADLAEDLWVLPDGRMLRIARQPHPGGGLLLIFSDITNEVALRSQYNALLETQRAALDKLHEAVVVFGLDGRLKLSNAAFQTMWKIEEIEREASFDRMVELCQKLFHENAVWAQIRARITDPSPEARTEFRGEMRRSDDSVLKFLTRPLPDGATLVAFQDISADRRVEDALRERAEAFEQADKLKGQFVENVSYQLRNPLQAIYGNAELMAARVFGPLNERQLDQVSAIIEASANLSKLIDNILDVAMVEAGNVQLDLAPMDVFEALQDSVQMAASKARDTEVPIRIKCDPKIGSIDADQKRITQVIVNLLSNALRHTERGDTITVSAERLDGVLRLVVADTGKGMPFEAQARAFDSFEAGDRQGAGLGLALVRSFIELHGGWVSLQSEPGAGVTVTCHLPTNGPGSPVAPPPIPPMQPRKADRAA